MAKRLTKAEQARAVHARHLARAQNEADCRREEANRLDERAAA